MKENKQPRDKRRRHIRITSVALTAAVTVIVVLLNVVVGTLAERFPLTADLTEQALYTLTEPSISLADQIERPVTVTFFMKQSFLQDPGTGDDFFDTVFRQMHAFANQYAVHSDGKVTVRYVDLTEDPALAGGYDVQVANYGVLFSSGEKSRYFTLEDMVKVEQGLNPETMAYENQYYSLVERTFAVGFVSVASEQDLHVTFLTGNGEKTNVINTMALTYEDNGYTVHTLNFATAADIPEKSKVLIVAGADKDFSDAQIERLTAWLYNDGKLGRHLYVLCDPLAQRMDNFYQFLDTYYGIRVSDNIIYETDPNKLVSANMPTFPLAQLQPNELMEGLEGRKVLLGNSLALDTRFADDPENLTVFNTDIVTFDGESTHLQFTTFDGDGNPIVVHKKADSYPIVGMAMACEWDTMGEQMINTYVFVSGGYDMVDPSFYTDNFANQSVVLDPIDKMCGHDIKVDVSAFSMSNEMLVYTVAQGRAIGLYLFTLGVPALLLAIGAVVTIRRRNR